MPRSTSFYDTYPATTLLLLLVLGIFGLEVVANQKLADELDSRGIESLLGFAGVDGRVLDLLGKSRVGAIQSGEVWRLVSAVFLHGGLIHLLCNVSALVYLGRLCELRLSSAKLFAAFVLSGLGGTILGLLVFHRHPEHASVGASGAIAGLLGIVLVSATREREWALRDWALRMTGLMVILSLLAASTLDHAGHAGGFLTGCLLGWRSRSYTTSREAARWRAPAYALGALVAVSLGFALVSYFSRVRA